MKALTIIGIILIVLGVVALAYQGISYTTTERVVDIGPLAGEHGGPLVGLAVVEGAFAVQAFRRAHQWSFSASETPFRPEGEFRLSQQARRPRQEAAARQKSSRGGSVREVVPSFSEPARVRARIVRGGE